MSSPEVRDRESGIARSLVVKPSIIIADEPVSALDVSIQAQVINLLMDIKKEMDLTILFIAHNLAVVKYFSDRIGVMHFGTMVELADADELYAHPVHPYTKSLLSAIPQPDPDREKDKQRIYYDPSMHDYSKEQPSFQEIRPGHFVYASDSEMEKYRKGIIRAGADKMVCSMKVFEILVYSCVKACKYPALLSYRFTL